MEDKEVLVFIPLEQPYSTFYVFRGGFEAAAQRCNWPLFQADTEIILGNVKLDKSGTTSANAVVFLDLPIPNLERSEGRRSDLKKKKSQEKAERKESGWQTLRLPMGSGLFIGSWNVVVLLVINHRQHSHVPLMHIKVLSHERRSGF